MRIEILSETERAAMRRAGRVAAEILEAMCARIEPEVSSKQVEQWVSEETQARGARSSQLGYHGFPAEVCVSRNECVCHGIPSTQEILRSGDVVNVDVTCEVGGFHGDTSKMVLVGEVGDGARQVVEVARQARSAGIAAVRPGARLGDIAAAVMAVAEEAQMSVVRELGGHGIGRKMHQEPHVPYVGRAGRGVRLKEGMCLTIEPMINEGAADVVFLEDGWRVVTKDGGLSAQFEHTVLVTAEGAEVLTELR